MAGWIKVVFAVEPAHFIKERLLGEDAKLLRGGKLELLKYQTRSFITS